MQVRVHVGEQAAIFDEESERLRWFLLPSDALLWLHDPVAAAARGRVQMPFDPVRYPKEVAGGDGGTDEVEGDEEGLVGGGTNGNRASGDEEAGTGDRAPGVGTDAPGVGTDAPGGGVAEKDEDCGGGGEEREDGKHRVTPEEGRGGAGGGEGGGGQRDRKTGNCWQVPSKAIFKPSLQVTHFL